MPTRFGEEPRRGDEPIRVGRGRERTPFIMQKVSEKPSPRGRGRPRRQVDAAELPEAVRDRLGQLLPEEALQDALKGLDPEEITGQGGLLSQLADLSGVRRGHVAVACSQAFADNVMPDEVEAYRARHPLVTFAVQVRDHADAVAALLSYEADLALVLEPPP